MAGIEFAETLILEKVQQEGFNLKDSDQCESLLQYPEGWHQGHFPFQARGMTLSHWAAHLNYPKLWKFLKTHDAISKQPDAKGMLPIHHACSSGAKDIFNELVT